MSPATIEQCSCKVDQIACGKILLPQLNRVDAARQRLLDDVEQRPPRGSTPIGDEVESRCRGVAQSVQRVIKFSTGLDALAWSLRGMRPARKALRPACTASRMASAIAMGSLAPAIAVFMRTASQPSSMATAASDAVPTPA